MVGANAIVRDLETVSGWSPTRLRTTPYSGQDSFALAFMRRAGALPVVGATAVLVAKRLGPGGRKRLKRGGTLGREISHKLYDI